MRVKRHPLGVHSNARLITTRLRLAVSATAGHGQ
jgi:hypothetical protein